MSTKQRKIPVLATLPTAYFVDGDTLDLGLDKDLFHGLHEAGTGHDYTEVLFRSCMHIDGRQLHVFLVGFAGICGRFAASGYCNPCWGGGENKCECGCL